MGRIAGKAEIEFFLRKVKAVAEHPMGFVLIPRKENMNVLAEYGFLKSFPRKIVQQLTISNYSFTDGDRDCPGEVWVFGKEIEGVSFYIKIKLDLINGREIVKCLSFHPEDPEKHPLEFPYRR